MTDSRIDSIPPVGVAQRADQAKAQEQSPDDWAKVLLPPSESGRPHADSWKHGAAAALHGWTLHAHHAGSPILLSRAAYEGALAAASEPVGAGYEPHPDALSPHAPAAVRKESK